MRFAPLTGRVLMALIYVVNGIALLFMFEDIAALMAGKGLPMTDTLLALTIAIWLIGGTALIIGWQVRAAALVLLVLTLAVTVVFHAPWSVEPAQFQNELNHFLKNLALVGGLLYVSCFGPGPFSVSGGRSPT